MSYIAYDIETIPSDKAFDYVNNHKVYKAPANYKDKDKIDAYVQEQKDSDFQKAGLTWWTGKIICICLHKVSSKDKMIFFNTDEGLLLTAFFKFLKDKCPKGILIGKNADMFDKPYIIGRAMSLNMGLTSHFRSTYPINDVDKIFSSSKSCGQIGKLSDYAYGLGLENKLFDGSQVYSLYQDNRHDDIKEYCMHDTNIVAEMIKRYYKEFEV
jgi:DNA polymerase elongation subunit (family B)